MQEEMRRAWLEVDLGALKRNAKTMADRARVPLLPMVKADGYGLGAIPVARALEELDPWGFGVATVAEGEELRRADIERPILVATPLLPWDFPSVQRWRLIPTFGAREAIHAWIQAGGGDWHLAIETGMNRSGVRWDEVESVADLIRMNVPGGVFTHLHSPDEDNGTLVAQQEAFRKALAALPVRPGVFIYGVGGGKGSAVVPEPVAHLRARVVELRRVPNGESVSYGATWRAARDSRVATLAIGYADGFRRAFSNGGEVLIRGRRVQVVGLVNMDMVMVDVTDTPCETGDVATLLGSDGVDHLDINEVARNAKLSPYELLVGLRMRVPRVYRQ